MDGPKRLVSPVYLHVERVISPSADNRGLLTIGFRYLSRSHATDDTCRHGIVVPWSSCIVTNRDASSHSLASRAVDEHVVGDNVRFLKYSTACLTYEIAVLFFQVSTLASRYSTYKDSFYLSLLWWWFFLYQWTRLGVSNTSKPNRLLPLRPWDRFWMIRHPDAGRT